MGNCPEGQRSPGQVIDLQETGLSECKSNLFLAEGQANMAESQQGLYSDCLTEFKCKKWSIQKVEAGIVETMGHCPSVQCGVRKAKTQMQTILTKIKKEQKPRVSLRTLPMKKSSRNTLTCFSVR